MGVVARRETRPGAVIVAISLPLSCRNFLQPLLHQLVRYVVVLDVAIRPEGSLWAHGGVGMQLARLAWSRVLLPLGRARPERSCR
jgi:hypothetical protein